MRISAIIILAFLVISCERSQKTAPLTAAQAGTLAMRLANDKADALFHHRPFQDNRPAEFSAGHWIWTSKHGVNIRDFEARVELAADGSTNSVDIKLLDNVNRLPRGF